MPAVAAKPGVHQVLATLRSGDAISNQALGIARVLREAGYDSEIIAEQAETGLRDLIVDDRDIRDVVGPDDIVLLHFSIGSRAMHAAFAWPSRMILMYHNVTPPEHFVGVYDTLARLCHQGRRELAAFRARVDLALGDSEYNRRELDALGFAPTAVFPVVPDFRHLSGPPDPTVLALFDDDWTNILFVGRVATNKRPDNLIRHVHGYQTRFNPRSRLLVAGTAEGFGDYLVRLRVLAAELGVEEVHFLGQVTNEALAALYAVADVFLSASEHEGFCVPLLEAFYMGVPVVALGSSAVPDTLDGGGVLYTAQDDVAAILHALVTDETRRDRVLAAQNAALGRWLSQDFTGLLLARIAQAAAAPRRPPPPVADGFWDAFEAVADATLTRPLAFHRLPPWPASRRRTRAAGARA